MKKEKKWLGILFVMALLLCAMKNINDTKNTVILEPKKSFSEEVEETVSAIISSIKEIAGTISDIEGRN